jgi:hypothetical protein
VGSTSCAAGAEGVAVQRRAEADRCISLPPPYQPEIDGLDIHFIHVRSGHRGALPLIVAHGWPGSVIEQLKIIGPLTDPAAHAAAAADALDLRHDNLRPEGERSRVHGCSGQAARTAGRSVPRVAVKQVKSHRRIVT